MTAGFQNSHVHFIEAKFADAAARPASELSAAMTDMLNRFGFTTVVDTASNVANTAVLRERIERGEVVGPRILTAGFALFPKDGIPIYLRDMPPDFLAMLSQPASVDEALADLQANLDAGADATKLFLMTPQGGGRFAFMQPDIALAAADETHRRGLPVLAHPTDIEGINLAIEAGVDVLVHTTIGEGKTVWDAALIEQMRAKEMALVPTLMLFPYEMKREELPQRVVDLATGDAVEQVRAYAKAGGQILFGTDVGYMTDYDPTEEYRLMGRALSPMEILASLTTAPAARWKESDASRTRRRGARRRPRGAGRGSRGGRRELREGPLHDPRRQAERTRRKRTDRATSRRHPVDRCPETCRTALTGAMATRVLPPGGPSRSVRPWGAQTPSG